MDIAFHRQGTNPWVSTGPASESQTSTVVLTCEHTQVMASVSHSRFHTLTSHWEEQIVFGNLDANGSENASKCMQVSTVTACRNVIGIIELKLYLPQDRKGLL